ncbi:DUF6752 domain-containing protein [Nocardioides pocheonensis]|uniref:DUF6752 domain-containing protein n=1 Tax=Nocardioides pocheonensis TaxID=661485 RepID=UPI0011CD7031|nr:DUF6752 domain-containing protein [Nocardioides pocheonensis]
MRKPAGLRRRVVDAVGGGLVTEMRTRIEELEAAVEENRNLNLRVAELVDLVQELLIPVASQDKDKIQAALAEFQRSL